MPQPLINIIRSYPDILGLVVTIPERASSVRTTLPVTAQVGVVPVLKTSISGVVGRRLVPTLQHRRTRHSRPSRRCPHLRRCPDRTLNMVLAPIAIPRARSS